MRRYVRSLIFAIALSNTQSSGLLCPLRINCALFRGNRRLSSNKRGHARLRSARRCRKLQILLCCRVHRNRAVFYDVANVSVYAFHHGGKCRTRLLLSSVQFFGFTLKFWFRGEFIAEFGNCLLWCRHFSVGQGHRIIYEKRLFI